MSQQVTVNVHDPRVADVSRFEYDGRLSITLGNRGSYGNAINLFATDEEWDAIVATVQRRRDKAGVIPHTRQPAVKNEPVPGYEPGLSDEVER